MKADPAGQLLLLGIPGPELDPRTAARFRRVQPGGFILFGRNIRSPGQLRRLIDDLRDLSAVPPIVTVDQEGGRVSRLRALGNEPPGAQQLRTRGDPELVRWHGSLTGRLLRLFGFNLDLCPVLDVGLNDDADNSLRGRCYGTTPEQVVELAGAFNDALRAEGIASCGKHFPGYAAARVDPHHELSTIDRSREQLEGAELVPYRRMAEPLDAVMTGHARYPVLDSGPLPASLSARVVRDLLRTEIGFGGLVMTDDLDMGAVLGGTGLKWVVGRAVGAGNDLAMICHRMDAIEEAYRALRRQPTARLDREVWELRVATLGEAEAARRSPEDGKRSPVEAY